jgi:ATP-dependent RNA helicase RhlE
LTNFKSGATRVLIATDIAARGIDVEDLTHVINYELPNIPETYVHRIGRTGRAGASGIALSFCDSEEKEYLRDIHKLIVKNIPMVPDHPYQMRNTSIEKVPNQPSADGNKKGHSKPNSDRGAGQWRNGRSRTRN